MTLLSHITKRKKEILKMLKLDCQINADPYENIARLKELEKIEKILKPKHHKPFKKK